MGSSTYRNAGRKPKKIDYAKYILCLIKFQQGEWDIDECAKQVGMGKVSLAKRMYSTLKLGQTMEDWFTDESLRMARQKIE